MVSGYYFGMLGRDLFQGIRLERNGSHEPYLTYPENRLASNCVPDEYQPSPLPLQELALSPLPPRIHYAISHIAAHISSGANTNFPSCRKHTTLNGFMFIIHDNKK